MLNYSFSNVLIFPMRKCLARKMKVLFLHERFIGVETKKKSELEKNERKKSQPLAKHNPLKPRMLS